MQQVAPATPALSPEELALTSFARASLDLFTSWEALRLAIAHGWGRPEGRTHLAEEIVDLFYTTATEAPSTSSSSDTVVPDRDEIESSLLFVLKTEFSIDLEDGSEVEMAAHLQALWRECVLRATTPPPWEKGLAERFEEAAKRAREMDGEGKVRGVRQGGSDDDDVQDPSDLDDSSDEDDEDEDEAMEDIEAPAPGPSAPRRKEEPVIDEDGFQMVPKKKGGRR